jgi:hypothetical protein
VDDTSSAVPEPKATRVPSGSVMASSVAEACRRALVRLADNRWPVATSTREWARSPTTPVAVTSIASVSKPCSDFTG